MIKGYLIGDPITQSLSHITHNAVMKRLHVPGSYEKLLVQKDDLNTTLNKLKAEDVCWIGVTMPLKQAIIPHLNYLNERAHILKTVNTIIVRDGMWVGENCDGTGALNAIEKKGLVKGKKVLIVGAGETAKSIAYEARLRGAKVFIYNRTQIRAESICIDLKIECVYELDSGYDVIINATSVGMHSNEMSIPPNILKGVEVVLDVVYAPLETTLLKTARLLGCEAISGLEMFLELSAIQLQWALHPKINHTELVDIMRDSLSLN